MKAQLKQQKQRRGDKDHDHDDQANSDADSGEQSHRDNDQSEDSDEEVKKWDYLEFKGLLFPEPYVPCGIQPAYAGAAVELTVEEEELIWYWYETIGSTYEHNPIFKSNFLKQFMVRFKGKDFDLFDFTPLYDHFANVKKEKKEKPATGSSKQENKLKRVEDEKNFSLALVDNFVQRLSQWRVEGPSLLRGRGVHPKAGLLKARIVPEVVTINVGESSPVPICMMPGHSWGDIVHKHDVTWLASYKDVEIKKSYKYIYLAANSNFKWDNDKKKYEKARVLKSKIEEIKRDYRSKLESADNKNKQLGTATYLIDTLALRVGNEKGSDEADTVGCCSLRVEHVIIEDDSKITLKFLGKDSIEYNNTVKVDPPVWNNLKSFLAGKSVGMDIFDKIDAQILNEYLRGLMEGLTAKVFRTYNASTTLQKELAKQDVQALSMEQKKNVYDEANRMVAILCNHQKTVTKKSEESFKKLENDLKTKQFYLEELKAHFEELKGKKKPSRVNKSISLENGKQFKMDFPLDKEQTKTLIDRETPKLLKEEKNFKKREDNKQFATGTSKLNYNDPRISVAWCKKNEVKIEKVFNKTQLSKFLWAMSTESIWEF